MTTAGSAAQPPANPQGQHQTPPTNGNGAQTKALSPVATFRVELEKMKAQIEIALPKHLDAGRMMRVVMTTIQRNPDLIECTRYSLFGAIMQCAQLGLEPDGILGHAYLVPYNESYKTRVDGRDVWKKRKVCQVIIGYKGLLKLARQSGEVMNIAVRAVCEGDRFDFDYGIEQKLEHRPRQDGEIGALTHVYAIVWLKGGGVHFEVMSHAQVEKIRQGAKSGDSPAWENHYDEMAKKTVLRKMLKIGPASVEDKMSRAIALDERHDAGLPQDFDADVIDIPDSDVREVPRDGDGATAEGSAAATPPAFVASTLAQRKQIAKLIAQAKVADADVLAWFHKADNKRETIESLSREEADEAIKHLNEVIVTEAPIS